MSGTAATRRDALLQSDRITQAAQCSALSSQCWCHLATRRQGGALASRRVSIIRIGLRSSYWHSLVACPHHYPSKSFLSTEIAPQPPVPQPRRLECFPRFNRQSYSCSSASAAATTAPVPDPHVQGGFTAGLLPAPTPWRPSLLPAANPVPFRPPPFSSVPATAPRGPSG